MQGEDCNGRMVMAMRCDVCLRRCEDDCDAGDEEEHKVDGPHARTASHVGPKRRAVGVDGMRVPSRCLCLSIHPAAQASQGGPLPVCVRAPRRGILCPHSLLSIFSLHARHLDYQLRPQ